jgi:DNA repair protein RadC
MLTSWRFFPIVKGMNTLPSAGLYALRESDLVLDGQNKKYVLKFKDIPAEEKPKEKLMKYGPDVLSLAELLAVVLNVGTTKENVLAMSQRLFREYGERAVAHQKNPKKLREALDIPLHKACQIVACLEIGRRFFQTTSGKPLCIRTPQQVYEYLRDMRDLPKEHLRGLYLNSHYHVVHEEVISVGSITASIVHPAEVFRPALERSASAVILVHNHPSGVATPSQADIEITKQLIDAGGLLGISLLDHVIVTKDAFESVPVQYS